MSVDIATSLGDLSYTEWHVVASQSLNDGVIFWDWSLGAEDQKKLVSLRELSLVATAQKKQWDGSYLLYGCLLRPKKA